MNEIDRIDIIESITRWYKHFGIDHIFSEIKEQANSARSGSVNFNSLEELKDFVMKNDICGLKKFSRNTVFSDGDSSSSIMVIGEAPGEEEDIQGKPFVGQSGQLFNNMLRAIGLQRNEVYITNIVFWRPPANRNPSAEEIIKCMPYVKEHIRLVAPKVILLLGGVATKSLFNTAASITSMRGKSLKYEGIETVVTYHPAYLLRSPEQKAAAFIDMIKFKKLLI